jgi:hypothetical protein
LKKAGKYRKNTRQTQGKRREKDEKKTGKRQEKDKKKWEISVLVPPFFRLSSVLIHKIDVVNLL